MQIGKKTGRVTIDLPFNHIEGDPGEIVQLVEALRAGTLDQNGKNKIILCHTKFVTKIASQYASTAPWYGEDLVSVAFVTLVDTVNNYCHKLVDNNIHQYIGARVASKCLTALYKSTVFRQSEYYLRTHKNVVPVTSIPKIKDMAVKVDNVRELREEIFSVAKTKFERDLLILREQGHKNPDIAKILQCTKTEVYETRTKIERRWEELCSSTS